MAKTPREYIFFSKLGNQCWLFSDFPCSFSCKIMCDNQGYAGSRLGIIFLYTVSLHIFLFGLFKATVVFPRGKSLRCADGWDVHCPYRKCHGTGLCVTALCMVHRAAAFLAVFFPESSLWIAMSWVVYGTPKKIWCHLFKIGSGPFLVNHLILSEIALNRN